MKIGNDILKAIRKRTKNGRNKNNKPFKKYSPDYFKAGRKVDLTLSGDMLREMTIVKDTRNTITIGWDDENIKDRAENHIHGVTIPKRDFLGITKKKLSEILDKNQAAINRAKKEEQS